MSPHALLPDLRPELRPRLRGHVHQWSAAVAGALGIALVAAADGGRETLAAAIYAASVVALFTSSAVYHRVTWRSPATRMRMRRVDHSAIFVLIAGTYTPIAMLSLDGTLADVILIAVWSGALAGLVVNVVWITAPRWLTAAIYVGLGWIAVAAMPEILDELGGAALALIAAGGLAYTAGAVIYARRRPDPYPLVFGYHEIFHVLVTLAAALHFAVIAFWVVD